MPEIRLLNEVADRSLLEGSWDWQASSPAWFKASWNAWGETKTQFLESAKNEMLFGVFNDGLTAVIRLIPAGNDTFCIHLSARRKTDFALLVNAGLSLRDYLFGKGVKAFFGYIPRQNRSIVKLYRLLGFEHNGVTRYKGQFHGKPIEWKLMLCESPLILNGIPVQ